MQAQLEINIEKLEKNINSLFQKLENYDYKFIDLRNNFFGLGCYLVNTFAKYFNYGLATNLNEAIKIRKYNREFPILIREQIIGEKVYDAIYNNITLTASDLNYLQEISLLPLKDDLKIHLFIDNGSNLIGFKTNDEIKKAIEIINKNKHLILEGIYTEISTYGYEDNYYYEQMANFLKIIEPIQTKNLLVHINEPLMYHNKLDSINGIKLDLSVIGLLQNFANCSNLKRKNLRKKYQNNAFKDLNLTLDLPWALTTDIKTISFVLKGTLIVRNYIAKDNMRVAILNIGHKDGITKALKVIVINNEICDILTDNIDEIVVKISDNISLDDKAYIISDYNNIDNVLANLKTNRYYLMSILNNDLKRVYIENNEEKEIEY